jgi:hypothetical protein
MTSTTRVGIPAVTWSVNAGAGAGGGNVVAAAIAAEPQDEEVLCACAKWGEPKWVRNLLNGLFSIMFLHVSSIHVLVELYHCP